MHKFISVIFLETILVCFLSICSYAQKGSVISGKVEEEDTSAPAIQTAVLLLSAVDSSMVDATVTDNEGAFAVHAAPGDYILKFSTIGYVTRCINIHQPVSIQGSDVGIVRLAVDNIMLESAKVTAQIEPVTVREDTLIYHAAAYRVADGAGMDELIKKIPGVEITPSGAVLMNGKPVSELLVNGKSFFGKDVATGLKNLQASMVESIVTYESQSEYALLSGIDDGEREPVINLTIRKSMMDGWLGNAILGGGTESRYRAVFNANNITGDSHKTLFANSDNCSDKVSFNNTSRNQVGLGGLGDAKDTKAGFSIAEKYRNLDYDGNIQFASGRSLVLSHARSESFNGTETSFNENTGTRESSNPFLSGNLKLEWTPDSLFTLIVKPFVRMESNRGWSQRLGETFRNNPFELQDSQIAGNHLNGSDNTSGTYGKSLKASLTVSGSLRSPKKKGRTFSFQIGGTYQTNDRQQYDSYLTQFYNRQNTASSLTRKLLSSSEEMYRQLSGSVSYSDRIGKGLFFQSSAAFECRSQSLDKGVYDLYKVSPDWNVIHTIDEKIQKDNLPDGYLDFPYDIFCSSGSYDWSAATISSNLRLVRKKFNLSAGVFVKPQKSTFHYPGDDDLLSVRTGREFKYGPVLVLRYVFSKNTNLRIRYHTSTGMPSMYDMLPIPSGTNPLYISVGNPDLRTPFNNIVDLSFNSSDKKKKSSFLCDITYRLINDAISQSSSFDTETGIRTSSPVNIDGNWNISGNSVFNKTLPGNRLSISNHTAVGYSNQNQYFYVPAKGKDEINVAKRFMAKELFEGSYRNSWLDVVLGGGVEYTDEKCSLRPETDQSPVTGMFNVSVAFDFPWKMRLEADLSTLFQRGYDYEEFNRNYYVLNLELSQRVIKNGTVRLGWYDVLKNLDNMERRFSASSRSITSFNGVNSYILASFVYSFKL